MGDIGPCRSFGTVMPPVDAVFGRLCQNLTGTGGAPRSGPARHLTLEVAVAFPPYLAGDLAVPVPLERFGIRDRRLTVVFRPGAF